MARTARASGLETRTARLRLKPRRRPYFVASGKRGVLLGYRRTTTGNGSWLVKRYAGRNDQGGKYETEVFAEADDYSDAEGAAILDYFGAMKRLGGELSEIQRSARYTVKDVVTDYVNWMKLNRKSARDAEWKLNHYVLKYFGGDKLASDVTATDFEKWPEWAFNNKPAGRRKSKPVKSATAKSKIKIPAEELERRRKSTLNRVLNLVKAAFNRAYLSGSIASDAPWRRLRRFKGADTARQHWLTYEDCTRLMNACEPNFRRIAQAALLTGARWSELRKLRVGDFDHRSGTVLIAQSKSGKARRVALNQEGIDAFESWTAGRTRDALICTRSDGTQWGEQDQKRPMKEACDGAKIKPVVGFHTLRHSYASALVQAKVSLAVIAEALGHSDTRMVSKHYGHLAPSHVTDAIRANLPQLGIEIETKVR